MDDWKRKLAQFKGDVPKSLPHLSDRKRENNDVIPSATPVVSIAQSLSGISKGTKLRPGMNYEDLISANETLSSESEKLRIAFEAAQRELQAATNRATVAEESHRLLVSDHCNLLNRLGSLDQEKLTLNQENLRIRGELRKLDSAQSALKERIERVKHREAAVREFEGDLKHLRSVERQLRKAESMFMASEREVDRLQRLLGAQKLKLEHLNDRLNGARDLAKERQVQIDTLHEFLADVPRGEVGIRTADTAQWLTSLFRGPRSISLPPQVLVIGEGPFNLDEIYDLLTERKFSVDYEWVNPRCEIVVVGRDNWNAEQIQEQIELRDGKPLRIYTQELFVIYLMLGVDPFELATPEDLLKFADDHSLMRHLLDQQFPWPDSQFFYDGPVHLGDGFESEDASSPMFRLGYSVAQSRGLTSQQRRQLLDKTFGSEDLPWCISDDYMLEWGTRASAARLRRMAWHIHLMTKRFRQHSNAVEKWNLDLEWLKETKYKPIHRFRWPV